MDRGKRPIQPIPGAYTEERETELILWINAIFICKTVFFQGKYFGKHDSQKREAILLGSGSSLHASKSSPKQAGSGGTKIVYKREKTLLVFFEDDCEAVKTKKTV